MQRLLRQFGGNRGADALEAFRVTPGKVVCKTLHDGIGLRRRDRDRPCPAWASRTKTVLPPAICAAGSATPCAATAFSIASRVTGCWKRRVSSEPPVKSIPRLKAAHPGENQAPIMVATGNPVPHRAGLDDVNVRAELPFGFPRRRRIHLAVVDQHIEESSA